MNSFEELQKWTMEHKLASVVITVIVLVVAGFSVSLFKASTGYMGAPSGGLRQRVEKGAAPTEDVTRGGGGGAGEYVEVKKAQFNVDTESADQSSREIRDKTENYGGYVEESRKDTTDLYKRIYVTARVPTSNFTDFVEKLKKEYDVDSYNVRNYRLGIQRELDELDILNKSLQEYESYREEIKEMNLTKEKLDLLMEITEKELWAKERMKHYKRGLAEKYQMSEYATVRITLEEKRVVDIAPENIGNRFNQQVKEMLDNVVTALIETVTGAVEMFFSAIKYIVYILIIAIPLALAYKLGKRIYNRYW